MEDSSRARTALTRFRFMLIHEFLALVRGAHLLQSHGYDSGLIILLWLAESNRSPARDVVTAVILALPRTGDGWKLGRGLDPALGQ